MIKASKSISLASRGTLFCFVAYFLGCSVGFSKAPPPPEMPSDWEVVSDVDVPQEQVEQIERKLGVSLSSLRNTVYGVKGKRVQLNVMITPDSATADKLMTKLRSMKVEEALLRKDLVVYEFVGSNEVLPVIAEGRRHLESK